MWPLRLSLRQQQGQQGEQRALAYLRGRGLAHVESNYRCSCGEIDLIMRDGSELVFVEVRQRADASRGGAAASISPAKQRRVVNAAQTYLQRYPRVPPCRIDVVTIDAEHLEWLVNAIEGPA